jgi:Ser/Thr protein kinase RdoA (MazF antagonist)
MATSFNLEHSLSYQTSAGKNLFPVVYSTLDAHALAALAFANYPINVPKSCQFWHRGLSDVYLLETLDNLYILRVSHYHWRTKTSVDFELDLLEFLRQRSIPVAAPIKTYQGVLSVTINAPEGQRYAALFPYAPGEVALGDLDRYQSRALGATLAQLHLAAQDFCPLAHRQALDLGYLLDDSLQVIAPCFHHRPLDLEYLLKAITSLKAELSQLPQTTPYWGICWGDPHSGNVHFTPDNQMTLFDFDQCGYGWRMFDLAKFLQVSLQSGLSRSIREAFFSGYEQITPLSDIEWSCLQGLTQAAYLWSWSINIIQSKIYDYSRLDELYLSQRLQTLRRLQLQDWQLF